MTPHQEAVQKQLESPLFPEVNYSAGQRAQSGPERVGVGTLFIKAFQAGRSNLRLAAACAVHCTRFVPIAKRYRQPVRMPSSQMFDPPKAVILVHDWLATSLDETQKQFWREDASWGLLHRLFDESVSSLNQDMLQLAEAAGLEGGGFHRLPILCERIEQRRTRLVNFRNCTEGLNTHSDIMQILARWNDTVMAANWLTFQAAYWTRTHRKRPGFLRAWLGDNSVFMPCLTLQWQESYARFYRGRVSDLACTSPIARRTVRMAALEHFVAPEVAISLKDASRWRTSDVVALARGVVDDPENGSQRLPILADALMDAGCEDEKIIGYCRSSRPKPSYNWLTDFLMAGTTP